MPAAIEKPCNGTSGKSGIPLPSNIRYAVPFAMPRISADALLRDAADEEVPVFDVVETELGIDRHLDAERDPSPRT